MKKICNLLFIFIIFILNISFVQASEEKNLVNIYLFHSDTCPHCKDEIKLLSELQDEYKNIKIYKYEVSSDENWQMLNDVAEIMDTTVTGVPFTVIGEKVYKGFSYENSKSKFVATINYYSDNGYVDKVGEYIGDIELPSYDVSDEIENVDEYIEENTNHVISFLGFKLETKNLTLPVISILIGLVDGFNPCAMWVLLFLISMLIGMKDRKKMWILGISFLLTSGFVYLLFMVAWLNAATLLITVKWFRLVIGLVAIVGSMINLVGYFKHRNDGGCNVVSDNKRNKIFDKIKKFTHEKNFFLAIIGAMTLAISVNIIELACSAGLPVMFTQILSMNELTLVEEITYITLYMLFFMIDDLIVFFIAMRTMELTGFSTKYGKLSKIIGGILLLVIGILMIFKPEWLMFNF